nr:MAG: putative coat protein [Eriocheir sinensis tombusvirus 4]
MAKKTKPVRVRVQKSKSKGLKKNNVTAVGQALRALGGIGGTALGGFLGNASAGSSLGTGLGATISRWLGQGDYTVSQNSIVNSVRSSGLNGSASIPMMHNVGQNVTIRHKEFISTIKGSINFTIQRFFLLQPGDTNTFPWLSGVANKFQQYRIKGMVFHYVPTSGFAVSGTNPAIGSVMMQTSYRANDVSPTTKVEILNEYWASESAPSEAFCHPIECSPKENPFQVHYTRTKPVPTNDSQLLYDLGVTYVATQGMQADGNPVGDLWVTYEIELLKPQITSYVLGDVFSGYGYSATGITPAAPLGAISVAANPSTSSIPFTFVGRTITFPIGLLGSFLISIRFQANTPLTAFDGNVAPTTLTNCTGIPVEANTTNTHSRVVCTAAATLNNGFYLTAVKLSDPSAQAVVVVPGMSWTGTVDFVTVTISALA